MVDTLYPGASDLEGRTIRQIVAVAMDAPARAASGHSGTAMAMAPLGVMLWARILRHDPTDPSWPDRDRFILSCGHASILQYALAHAFGYDLSVEDLKEFRQLHSRTPGHPERGVTPTVEVTTGPLGQGIANGVGMALAERILRADYGEALVNHRTWVIAGDGCLEEGISHEAASLAGSLGLGRLTVFYDDNHITIDGPTELALHDDAGARFEAYGWQVIRVGENANDLNVLEAAVREAVADTDRPTLIVVRSHIGFPAREMMDRKEAHGTPFSPEVIAATKELLGLPNESFYFEPHLKEELSALLVTQRDERAAWSARVLDAGDNGARLIDQLSTHGAKQSPLRAEAVEGGTMLATRRAMQRAMDAYAVLTPGLTAGSADLTDNTGVELKHSTAQRRDNPGGRQIHFGIREHAMTAILTGQAHHGGFRPVGSTFFVFSDYARPAVRLAALSHAGTLMVYTHDSIGVGEDGPTHEPIEHLMSLRAMPNLHVVRPSDANETLDLVEEFLSAPAPNPTALVLSRQDMPVFAGSDALASAKGARRGGYVVRDDDGARFTLVGTGSEVGVCLAANDTLRAKGIPTRVVAMPCWRCFDQQPIEYQRGVLRRSTPSLAIEAGATLGWANYVDASIGIDHFGMSAPGRAIFDYFEIIASNVVDHVERALGELA